MTTASSCYSCKHKQTGPSYLVSVLAVEVPALVVALTVVIIWHRKSTGLLSTGTSVY